MRMPILTCNRCGKEDTRMVDAPRLDDPRVYCIECYAELFPPGWTDDNPPLWPDEDSSVDTREAAALARYEDDKRRKEQKRKQGRTW